MKTLKEKLYEKTQVKSAKECWIFTGAILNQKRFGRLNIDGQNYKAHHVSWLIHNSDVPKHMEVHHKCNNDLCVNPNHLYLKPKLTSFQRFWNKVNKKSKNECWNWQGAVSTSGYGNFYFDGKYTRPHRLSYELHHGKIPKGLHVCHRCDNRLCVNPNHLFIGTAKDNAIDRINKGRSLRGERAYNNKLSKKQVIEIRKRYNPGIITAPQLAKEFNVTKQAIYSAVYRISWKWL